MVDKGELTPIFFKLEDQRTGKLPVFRFFRWMDNSPGTLEINFFFNVDLFSPRCIEFLAELNVPGQKRLLFCFLLRPTVRQSHIVEINYWPVACPH